MSTDRLTPTLWLTVAFLAAGASAASAQLFNPRQGLWVGAGAGYGSAEATCSVCLARQTGPLAVVGVGGTLSGRVLAGFEGTGWMRSEGAVDRSFFMAAAVGAFYPARNLGLHVKAGLGQYWYVEEDATTELSTRGLALLGGAAFDVSVVRGLSLSPFGTIMTSGFGNPTRTDKASGFRLPLFSDMKVDFLSVGLTVILH